MYFFSRVSVLQKDETDIKDLVDFSYVSSDHVLYMSIAAALKVLEKSSASVAVIGVGGGALCLLLRDLFPNITVTGIELDPLVIELAQKYFGLKVDERLKIIVNDGVKFLKEKNKFDVIMFDVDSKQLGSALSCPPLQFIEPSVLNAVAESLGDEGIV